MGLSLEVSIGIPLRVESHLEKCKNGMVVPEEYRFNKNSNVYILHFVTLLIIKIHNIT